MVIFDAPWSFTLWEFVIVHGQLPNTHGQCKLHRGYLQCTLVVHAVGVCHRPWPITKHPWLPSTHPGRSRCGTSSLTMAHYQSPRSSFIYPGHLRCGSLSLSMANVPHPVVTSNVPWSLTRWVFQNPHGTSRPFSLFHRGISWACGHSYPPWHVLVVDSTFPMAS